MGGGGTVSGRRAEALARGWIEAWIRMDMDWLRANLADDFVHVSPFGRLEGRESYLITVEPMARKSVRGLTVREVVATDIQAAVWFENETPHGVVQTCDWVRIDGDRIAEIRSFYDASPVRETLTRKEQARLGGEAPVAATAPGRVAVVNLEDRVKRVPEPWSPRVVAELNDYQAKVARLEGEFVWHAHDETDELFLVLGGQLRIDFRDHAVELREGDLCVVPRGVEHRPVAERECRVMLVEPRGTVNTGNTKDERTREGDAWI